MLLDLGAASVHSFTTADAALTWLAAAKADIGVLDISLGTTTSFPVADALQQRAVPLMFTTGYGDSAVDPRAVSRCADRTQALHSASACRRGIAKCLRPRRLDA